MPQPTPIIPEPVAMASGSLKITVWRRPLAGPPVSIAHGDAVFALAPRLGPTSTLLLLRCTLRFDAHAPSEWTTLETLGAELGVSGMQMRRTVERLVQFGYARWSDDPGPTLEIATRVARSASGNVIHFKGATPPPRDAA